MGWVGLGWDWDLCAGLLYDRASLCDANKEYNTLWMHLLPTFIQELSDLNAHQRQETVIKGIASTLQGPFHCTHRQTREFNFNVGMDSIYALKLTKKLSTSPPPLKMTLFAPFPEKTWMDRSLFMKDGMSLIFLYVTTLNLPLQLCFTCCEPFNKTMKER